ncbi:MAG TPA: diguanylate cyclase [Novosphingobium sp.]|nr:diguanylate cyclase [Novosphingobium sp.]
MKNDILIVDDDLSTIQVFKKMLAEVGSARFATHGAAAIDQIRMEAPDVILLDAEMPGMTGFEVCQVLKGEAAYADIPVIFVTAHNDHELELRGLEAGAVDFISKPVNEALLRARVRTHLRLKQMSDELRKIATIDGLTQVGNRRRFDEALQREWARGIRNCEPISLLMIDVDHFKPYNDHYGHPAGDACLRLIAEALGHCATRPADVVCRYGGEEFVVLLPQTPRDGAAHVATRIREAVENLCIPHGRSTVAGQLTVSIGIGAYDWDSPCWSDSAEAGRSTDELRNRRDALVAAADKALYCAKRGGRNQVWMKDIDEAQGAFRVNLEMANVENLSARAR